ncbi:MAG: ACT domain-containing protein [Novosphingobium sp.]|nr:ACT domain-containing protein [Novosphingobium sp.]
MILMAVGDDRPGLTRSLADAIVETGGNWLESHFARLGGKFVGSVLVELSEERVPQLEQAAGAMDAAGFSVSLVPSGKAETPFGRSLSFELVGKDRPGIVQEVAAALASLEVNIEELKSGTEAEAMSGEKLFRASARAQVPDGTSVAQVRDALEHISGEIMVDFED